MKKIWSGIKLGLKKIWAFLTHKWVKPIILILVLLSVGIASYQAGSYKTFKDMGQRPSFTTGSDNQIVQSDVTENLMSTSHGQKEYANIVNATAMKTALEKNGVKIPDSRLKDYSQYDVQDFKRKNPKGTSADFEANALTRYGSDKTYEFRATMDVARAMYAEKHYDYSRDLNERIDQLKGMKSHTAVVSVQKDGQKSEPEKMTLTPYQYLVMVGSDYLDNYKNAKKGETFSAGDYTISVKDNGKAFTKNDVKKAMKEDTKFFLNKDIQSKMDKRIQKDVLKNDKLIHFEHPFDKEMYRKGVK